MHHMNLECTRIGDGQAGCGKNRTRVRGREREVIFFGQTSWGRFEVKFEKEGGQTGDREWTKTLGDAGWCDVVGVRCQELGSCRNYDLELSTCMKCTTPGLLRSHGGWSEHFESVMSPPPPPTQNDNEAAPSKSTPVARLSRLFYLLPVRIFISDLLHHIAWKNLSDKKLWFWCAIVDVSHCLRCVHTCRLRRWKYCAGVVGNVTCQLSQSPSPPSSRLSLNWEKVTQVQQVSVRNLKSSAQSVLNPQW